jgi:hypothetical protein
MACDDSETENEVEGEHKAQEPEGGVEYDEREISADMVSKGCIRSMQYAYGYQGSR